MRGQGDDELTAFSATEQPRAFAMTAGAPQPGHRDLARLIDHVAHDEIVAWGWAPGPGRAAVPAPRHDVVAAMHTWADAGAPCPD